MALVDATLQAALEAIDAEAQAAPMSSAVYNAKIAKAHSDFIKTGTVTVPIGVTVTTPDTINGATTAAGIGAIT
jgi:hypothetical protein